jgi:hypothetical protein
VPCIVRRAGAERLLELELPSFLLRGFVGLGLRQACAALVVGGASRCVLLSAFGIVLGFGRCLRRLLTCLTALGIGAA